MPIGRTPGHVLRAIRLQALKELKKLSSSVAILIASLDTVLQRSIEEELYDVKSRLHSAASRPDGPWLPFVFIAARFYFRAINFFKNRRMERQIPILKIGYYVFKINFLLHACFSYSKV